MAYPKLNPMKLKIGFKLVAPGNWSAVQRRGEGQTKYITRSFTVRKVDERNGKRLGGLAVFQDLESAEAFKGRGWLSRNTEIYLCLYQESRCITMWFYDRHERKRVMRKSQAPYGTVLADYVLLVEKVK